MTYIGGTAVNVLTRSTKLRGTIRFADDSIREKLEERIETVAKATATAFKCNATLTLGSYLPATVNDERAYNLLQSSAQSIGIQVKHFGGQMGAEDFGRYNTVAPSAFMLLGAGGKPHCQFGPHHPKFDINEDALQVGASLHARAALDAIRHLEKTCDAK